MRCRAEVWVVQVHYVCAGPESRAREHHALRQAFLAQLCVDTLPLSSIVVFDTSKVYTERDTRTREVFIIGVRPLRSRNLGTKERGNDGT